MQQTMAPQVVALPAPELGAVFSHAWERGKQSWPTLLLVGIVAWVVMIVAYAPVAIVGMIVALAAGDEGGLAGGVVSSLLGLVYQLAVVPPLMFGVMLAFLKAARGEAPKVDDLFACFRRNWPSAIGAYVLTAIAIGVASIFLIIPGIVVAVRLIFVPFLVVDEGLGAAAALQESWRRTGGHFWALLGAGVVAGIVMGFGMLLLFVGIIPAAIWMYLALATYFASITAARQAAAA